MIIAIDGPSASGKSTTAVGVSLRLGITYLDTGAMYRGITYMIKKLDIDVEDEMILNNFLKKIKITFDESNNIWVDGINLSGKIRSQDISSKSSEISQIPVIREKMVDIQRTIGNSNDCVLEGRDIGTVVFPNAEYKFFLIADLETRAKRRYEDMKNSGEECLFNEVLNSIKIRDEMDSNREYSPLTKDKDAIIIDTGKLKIDEQINKIVEIVNK